MRGRAWTLVAAGAMITLSVGTTAQKDRDRDRAATPAVIATDRDDGRTKSLRVGEVIRFELASNATTGFKWRVVRENRRLLTPVREDYREMARDRVGAGGTQIFEFRAKRAGTVTLQFHYRRPWEHKETPERSLSVKVSIKERAPDHGK